MEPTFLRTALIGGHVLTPQGECGIVRAISRDSGIAYLTVCAIQGLAGGRKIHQDELVSVKTCGTCLARELKAAQ